MKIIDLYKELNSLSNESTYLYDSFTVNEISGISFYAVGYWQRNHHNITVLANSLYSAELIRDEIITLIGEDNVIYIPSEELVMVEYTAASNDILSDRVYGLSKAIESEHKIIVTNVAAAARFYPSVELFKELCFQLSVDEEIDPLTLKRKLINAGYELVNKIDKTGQIAIRGDIFDIYSLNQDFPIRIDFFDNTIERLSFFHISDQQSFSKTNNVSIIPASDLLFNESDLINCGEKIIKQAKKDLEIATKPGLISNCEEDISLLTNENKDSRLYKYFSFVSSKYNTLFDYLQCETLIFQNYSNFESAKDNLIDSSREFLLSLSKDGTNITHLEYYNEKFLSKVTAKKKYNISIIDNPETNLYINEPVFISQNFQTQKASIDRYIQQDYKIYLTFISEQQKLIYVNHILSNAYEEQELLNLCSSNLFFIIDSLPIGADFVKDKILILTQKELFRTKYGQSRYNTKFQHGTILKSYEDLEEGDYVVHENYGIGIFEGIKQVEHKEGINDYIKIHYAGEDVLYVPLEQFKLIRKYVSKEGYKPKLSKLFSDKWENTKKKIKQKVNLLADKLVALYKERLNIKGFACSKDDVFQLSFDNDFDYELTSDQRKAVDEVKKDMESPNPMDRLVCGDVGFGKTEVAFRAAFKAIENGRQVLFLCPTTLLAKQHFERANQRFAKYDVKTVCLSRFLSTKQFNNAVKDIAEGKIHFVIGTHKALSKKVIFKDLGLLIIDEEQRFGVEHKEKIKLRFPNIDVLTMSATPIPRTLQTALVGIKSLSLINTAPRNRAPIQTYLVQHDPKMLINVIEREIGRGGQCYYIHNNISTITNVVDYIKKSIPGVTVAFIHGQMDKEGIDEIMSDFYDGKIQVLVCTTIVENGIDVANANLIIVENADRFGLAQLYQIKGRVGRSNKLAYAYLTYKKEKNIDDVAMKRLKAIKEFTQLGSGYKIAQRDLMIRGAGDILGPEQAGFIDDIGIDLYLKLLNEAIKEKETGIVEKTNPIEYKKIPMSGYVPDTYANSENKFEIYQMINNANTLDELKEAKKAITDIYGKIPKEIENILKIRTIKIKLNFDIFVDFVDSPTFITLCLSDQVAQIDGIGSKLMAKIYPYGHKFSLKYVNNQIRIIIYKNKDWVSDLEKVINDISLLYNGNV